MTQHDLAEATGMPQPSVARIERGTVIPRTVTLITMLRAAGYRLAVEPIGPAVDREAIRRQLVMDVPQRTRRALGRRASGPGTGPFRILRRLLRFGVPFVLIGELAEVAHGSPAGVGRVIDVCVASTDVAPERLRLALTDVGATEARRLRVMTETSAGDNYDVLVRNAVRMHVASGMLVRVAALEDLIRVRRSGRTPDQDAAAVLEALLEVR